MKPISPFTEQFIPTELLNKHFVKSGTYGYLPLIARDGNTHLFYWCEHWENLIPVGATLRDYDRPTLTFKVTKHIKDPSADDDLIIVCEGTSTDEDLEVMYTHLTYINDSGQWNFSGRNYSIATGMSLDNSKLVWCGGYSHFISKTGKTETVQGLMEQGDSGKVVLGITKNRKLVCVGSNNAFTSGDQTNLIWSNCYFSIKYAKTLGYKGFKMIDEPLIDWDSSFSNVLVEDMVKTYSDFNFDVVEPTPTPDPIEPTPDPIEPTPDPIEPTGSIDQEPSTPIESSTPLEYSHLMWTITKRRDSSSNSIQVSEFELLLNGEIVPFTNCDIVALDNRSPSREEPSKLIDGTVDTKWLDFNFTDQVSQDGESVVIISSNDGSKLKFDGYNWKTANDAEGRDPISWKLECSNDGEVWDLVDIVEDYNVTNERKSSVGPWKLVVVDEPTPEPEPLTLEQRVEVLEDQVKILEDRLGI